MRFSTHHLSLLKNDEIILGSVPRNFLAHTNKLNEYQLIKVMLSGWFLPYHNSRCTKNFQPLRNQVHHLETKTERFNFNNSVSLVFKPGPYCSGKPNFLHSFKLFRTGMYQLVTKQARQTGGDFKDSRAVTVGQLFDNIIKVKSFWPNASTVRFLAYYSASSGNHWFQAERKVGNGKIIHFQHGQQVFSLKHENNGKRCIPQRSIVVSM